MLRFFLSFAEQNLQKRLQRYPILKDFKSEVTNNLQGLFLKNRLETEDEIYRKSKHIECKNM